MTSDMAFLDFKLFKFCFAAIESAILAWHAEKL